MKRHLTTLIIFILIITGLVFITISSPSEANNLFGDQLYFTKKQIFWIIIGLISYLVTSRLNIKLIRRFTPHLYLFSSSLLLLVLIPSIGQKVLGARRWLEFGHFNLQPSELFKLSAILFFSHTFTRSQFRNLKTLLIYLALPLLLIILQPNLSTAIIIALIIISIYYLSGAEIIPLFWLTLVTTGLSLILILTSGYRLNRLKALLNQDDSTTTLSYHSNQIVLAISSGGLFGKGLANSEQKYRYLPKISTDSILAIIGEETGFLGIASIMGLYLTLIIHIFITAQSFTDQFCFLTATGIGCWLAYQSLVNISSLAGLIPITGIPLPLISYGGSSITTILIALGLFRSLEKSHGKNK